MSQDLLGPMNIKIVTDENENHVFTSNQEKKLLFEKSILFFDDAPAPPIWGTSAD